MTRKRLLVGGGVVAIAIIAVAIFLVWWLVLRDDSPPPVSLEGAVSSRQDDETPAETTPSPTAEGTEAATAATTATAQPEAQPTGIDGTWTLAEGEQSFVGYRVEEELATIGYKEAVGRSPTIDATVTIEGGRLTGVTVTADLRDLRSDDPRRDGAIRNQALESNAFPMAIFELTEPVDVPPGLAEGEPVAIEANGTLTLHGVTRAVTIPIEAEQRAGGLLLVVGSLPIVFADYDIDQPRSPILVSIEDNGIMELQLFLQRGP